MQQPEAYLGSVSKSFDDTGKLSDPSTQEFLEKFGQAFERWIERVLGP